MSRLLPRKIYTLVVLHNESCVLLGLKKRGFGKGKWNGFGGKVEEGETIAQAAMREVKEECGLVPQDLVKVGGLEFEFVGCPEIMHVHVFKSHLFTGDVTESEEMLPRWFLKKEIPWDSMWPDDKFWLPLLFQGQKFHGYFLYADEDIIEKRLQVVDMV